MDSPKLRRLLVDRTGGITLGICKVLERAATRAIEDGTERISLESFADPEIWRGVAMPARDARVLPRAALERHKA